MRRWCLLVLASSLVLSGCFGQDSYQKRLANRLAQLERDRRIEKNLMPAPAEKKFRELAIYVRPPKDEAELKVGQLPVGEGQFELDSSFKDKEASILHVLARVKLPKKAPTKGQPPTTAAPAARGDFPRDVLAILTGVFGPVEAFATPKFADEVKRGNRFKRLIATANDKEVKLYTYKEGNYEVALIFAYDPKVRATIASKIDLCLETFAAGPKAKRNYDGGETEEEDAAASGPAAPM